MASTDPPPLKRTIKKPQLHQMVPLADSTIWEMEKRGQFPRRFLLTPRCVVWDLAEVEAWLLLRRTTPIHRAAPPDVRKRISRPVRDADRSGEQRLRDSQLRRIGPPLLPGFHSIGPFLGHVTALRLELRLVVDAA